MCGRLVLEIIIRANICCVPDIAPKALHMLPLQPLHLPCEVSAIHSRNLLPNESKTGGLLIEEIFKAGHLRIHKMSTLLNVMLVRVHWLGDLLMQSQASLRPGPAAKGLPCAACIARTCAAVCVPIWVSLAWRGFTDAREATYTQNPSGFVIMSPSCNLHTFVWDFNNCFSSQLSFVVVLLTPNATAFFLSAELSRALS